MTRPRVAREVIAADISASREALIESLSGLTNEQWDAMSLCEGWHLDAQIDAQQSDGGWTFNWSVWTPGTEQEWRSRHRPMPAPSARMWAGRLVRNGAMTHTPVSVRQSSK
jgi:hypothetical protein